MKRIIRESYVEVLGRIWMPGTTAACRYDLDRSAVEQCRDNDGAITRGSMEKWLSTHAGDFQSVTDFSASVEDGADTITIPWGSEDHAYTFEDCMWPAEREA